MLNILEINAYFSFYYRKRYDKVFLYIVKYGYEFAINKFLLKEKGKVAYITLLFGNRLYNSGIKYNAVTTIGSGKKDDIHIENMREKQIVIRTNRYNQIAMKGEPPIQYYNDRVPKNTAVVLSRTRRIMAIFYDQNQKCTETLKLPYQGMVHFGRSEKNDVVIRNPYVSGRHFTIYCEEGVIRIEDHNSTNGLFVNRKQIQKARLHSGDVISILNMNMYLNGTQLSFENVGGELQIQYEEENTALGGDAKQQRSENGNILYKRSPRTQEQLPSEDIILAAAPTAGQKYEKRKGSISSFVGTGVMFAANMVGGSVSPALMAARAASLVSPITSMVGQSNSEKDRRKKGEDYAQRRMEKYGEYIVEQRARINAVAQKQREILTNENPAAVVCMDRLHHLQRTLWERSAADRDFLDVRMGMGYEKLCVQVKSRESIGFVMESDEVRELAEQIIEETRIVDLVPARLSLKTYKTVSVIGERQRVIRLVRNMLVSLTTAHSFQDVHIVGIFDREEMAEWQALRWLPHIWDDQKKRRFLAFDAENAHSICDSLIGLMRQRAEAGSGYQREKQIPLPYYIFVLGSRTIMEKEELMQYLTSNNEALGVSSIFLFDDLYSLPHSCQFIVDVDNGPCGYVRNEANHKFMFTEDEAVKREAFDGYTRAMSAIELDGPAAESAIPDRITFMEGMNVGSVEDLHAMERWNSSRPYESLAAPIGRMSGGRTFALDIHEKAHGPHGLVAGTTGSGKSEVLQSWILSMCLNYHPYDVNFVIIDYKGGGMANLLMDLPHVVGKITNIGSNIGRALISLEAEMKRRQRVFAGYEGVNHIDKYQKLYREGKVKEPMPHLILVADEFAELKKEEPEFMSGLISASRIGRSLGVHLVLATQKPSGVVDEQIQSNSNFRLCLKVQSAGDSREMIKRPDAAGITQAGRAYIRVGEDAVFELFQSYWSGAPYIEGGTKETEASIDDIHMVMLNGERRHYLEKKQMTVSSDMDELTAIRQYLKRTAEVNGIRKLDGPWLPELPAMISVAGLGSTGGYNGLDWHSSQEWLKIPIGIYDAPALQKQGVQYINPAAEGHYGIYGAPSTGKTELLKTIVWSVAVNYSPKDVNIYIIDCGGWSMNVFSQLPHVGGIALDCEEEKFGKLAQMLGDEITERKKAFLSKGVSSLQAYRQATDGAMPAIILMIDNIIPIFDQYPEMEELLITLARDGGTYGMYMIYTANNTTGVRYKIVQNIRGAIAFELTDKGDYPGIVGRLDGRSLPKVAGRAFFKSNPPIEFQAAMAVEAADEADRTQLLKQECAAMDAVWDGERPEPIPVMPDELSFDDVYKSYNRRTVFPVGVSYETTRTIALDLSQQYVMAISGTMSSGKSTYLMGMIEQIRRKQAEDKIYVIDSLRGSLSGAVTKATAYTVVNQEEKLTAILSELVDALNTRKRAQNQARSMAAEGFSEESFIADYPQLIIFIDDLKEYVDSVSDNNKNTMERICRMAQGLGVIVVAAGRVTDLERYNEIESLTRVILSNQKGIGLGGSAQLHTFFRNDLNYKEKEAELAAGEGLYYDNGHCVKMKLPME